VFLDKDGTIDNFEKHGICTSVPPYRLLGHILGKTNIKMLLLQYLHIINLTGLLIGEKSVTRMYAH
jgi:hypothetical protein